MSTGDPPGEVRVNKVAPPPTPGSSQIGDEVRVPPVRGRSQDACAGREFPVVFEDDHLIAVNKPAGVAVHGGSGVSFGVIEQLRRRARRRSSSNSCTASTRRPPACC